MRNQSNGRKRKRSDRGGPREQHRGGGRRRKLGRLFAHGDLRFLILKLISEKPRHGYEIIKAIEEQVAGTYSPSPGVIYPTLTLLEELDWIRAIPSEGSKKLFEVTPDGSLSLKANRTTVEAILARMAEANEARSDDASREPDPSGGAAMAPRLRLALDDLKRAIERRLASVPGTEDHVPAIVAALSTAATEIEGAGTHSSKSEK